MPKHEIFTVIKSYKRAGRITTHNVVPFAKICVPESQGDEYKRQYGDRVYTVPDAMDGNLCRKQNAILDTAPSPYVLILDDDINGIGYWEGGLHFWSTPSLLQAFIEHAFEMAEQLDVHLWGINQRKDELCYQTYKPISLLAPILGPLHGHLESPIRFDEELNLKEDYDLWLQHIQHYHKTLRFNKWHYCHDSAKLPGGQVSIRTLDRERAAAARLMAKWGSRVVKPGGSAGGKSATGKNILNTLVKIPINGC